MTSDRPEPSEEDGPDDEAAEKERVAELDQLAHDALDLALGTARASQALPELTDAVATLAGLVGRLEPAREHERLEQLAAGVHSSARRLAEQALAAEESFGSLLAALTGSATGGVPAEARARRAAERLDEVTDLAEELAGEIEDAVREAGRLAAGVAALADGPESLATEAWELALAVLDAVRSEDIVDQQRLAVGTARALRRDLIGFLADLAVHAPSVGALDPGAGAPAAIGVVLDDELLVKLGPRPGEAATRLTSVDVLDGLGFEPPTTGETTWTLALDADWSVLAVAELLAELLTELLGTSAGDELSLLFGPLSALEEDED